MRAAPDAPAGPTDTDADGVADSDDRCPLVADNQNDEDGDGIGDRCDNCPLDVNPDQDNKDSDGLGDACDALSNAFDCTAHIGGLMTLDAWTIVSATWTVDNGDLVVDNTSAQQGLIVSTASYAQPYVVVTVELTKVAGNAILSAVEVWGQTMAPGPGGNQTLPNGVLAQVYDTTNTPAMLRLMVMRDQAGSTLATQKLAPDANFAIGTNLRMSIDLRTGTLAGAATSGTSNAIVTDTTATAGSAPVALRVLNVGARVRNVWIVVPGTDPCPPPTQ